MCGTVWCVFGGLSVCYVWDSLGRVLWSDFVLCVDSLVWFWGSEFVLFVGQFGVGLGEWVCAVCGIVWGGFGGCESVLCVGHFRSCLEVVVVCCVWESLERVWR